MSKYVRDRFVRALETVIEICGVLVLIAPFFRSKKKGKR